MDWSLLDLAKNAEDVASGLQIYVDEIPGYDRDFLAHISALFAISAELRRLDQTISHPSARRAAVRLTHELDLLCSSLELTLETVKLDFFGVQHSAYSRRAWDNLSHQFEREGRTFGGRLVAYQGLAVGLSDILQGDRELEDIEQVVLAVKRLKARQLPPNSDRYEPPPMRHRSPPARPSPRPSPRRNPPYMPHSPISPISPMSPLAPLAPLAPISPLVSSDDWDSDDMFQNMPAVPAPPLSPTFSNSSYETYASFPTSPSVDSSTSSYGPVHWATKIFDGLHPMTPFQGHLGQPTRCLGRDVPSAVNRLWSEGFQKVVDQPFDGADAFLRLYWRSSDHRARILFLSKDSLGRRYRHCIPLTGLKIQRVGPCLQLCRVNQYDGKLDLWANLRFLMYERMVLFYCTAVALKRQDSVDSPLSMEDFFQPGEEMEYSGEIEDDRYLHAFRVFRDKNTGAVRFEATARRGPMQKTPIWTAFVSPYIGSTTWMRKVGPRILSLRELHPYVFCDNYSPPRGRDGRFELRFRMKQDCEDFMETFHALAM